ncbi:E3 ubiquitin-protein ligase ATL42 [Prosopis cineraria]|uniref:E3 ubiquitin-protein ligase ATL42 n=1 Tax=Prosopis cineraria TaxID=364024 RepID=UPI00240ED88B|nr:E3 ubiquitin-protein ligase ATL42 [Prosopis cineraria]
MNHLGFHLLFLNCLTFFFRFFPCQAQVSTSAPSQDVVSNFRPSLAVVIGILSFMFVLTFSLLMFAKCCNRGASSVHGNPEGQPWLIRTRSRFSGIDKTVIESLPFFRFSSLKGSKEGLECAVCLSKFEDIEILRLLPKCKHAFHINCIDHWLEKHSSCPLCRHRVDPEDQTIFTYSNSLRLLINGGAELEEESNLGLFIQREEQEQPNGSSSRFNFGSSFRRIMKGSTKEEIAADEDGGGDHKKVFHKHKHKITASDFVLKNRWSNVSSSDLMFLNSEMLGSTSSVRLNSIALNDHDQSQVSPEELENGQVMNIKEEMGREVSFDNKVMSGLKNNLNSDSDSAGYPSHTSKNVNPDEKRSVSDITAVPRFEALGMKNDNKGSSLVDDQNNVKEERVRQIWLPIAKRTVRWFVNREKRFQQSLNV